MFPNTSSRNCGNHSLDILFQEVGCTVAIITDILQFVRQSSIFLKAPSTSLCDENIVMLDVWFCCIKRENGQHTSLFENLTPRHNNATVCHIVL